MKIYLNEDQKCQIIDTMNPPGSNSKNINFFNVLSKDDDSYRVEVGYWITYIGCKPKYQKETRTFNFNNTAP